MPTFHEKKTINFAVAAVRYPDFAKALAAIGVKPADLPDLTANFGVHVELDDFDLDDIEEYLEEKRPSYQPDEWQDRVYRLMAEGDLAAAMEEMARALPHLPPPSHELAIADLLTRTPKASAHVHR